MQHFSKTLHHPRQYPRTLRKPHSRKNHSPEIWCQCGITSCYPKCEGGEGGTYWGRWAMNQINY